MPPARPASRLAEPSDAARAPAAGRDALDRLTPFGWSGGLAAIFAGLALSFALFGYGVAYWRNADMDFMVVYNALLLNDGKPQEFFDHPAYWTILSAKFWFQALHAAGLLDTWTLAAIPRGSDLVAYDAAMTQAIRAGRVLALLTAGGVIAIFAVLARRLFADWRVALLATFAFAYSGGVAVHMRILRTEMIAAALCIFALMILMLAARRGSGLRPLWIGLAAALCMLGIENKVHAVLLAVTLPALAIAFGAPAGASTSFWRSGRAAWLAVAGCAIVAAFALALAWPLLTTGFDPAGARAAGLTPVLFGTFGAYQVGIGLWIVACAGVHAAVWRISPAETLATLAAIVAGLALALLPFWILYDPRNLAVALNPLERLLVFAAMEDAGQTRGGLAASIGVVLGHVKDALLRFTFVLHSSPRPTVFLTWLIFPGIVVLALRGERLAAARATLLMLAAIAIDAAGIRRGLKAEYFILSDPLIILAGAILLERAGDLTLRRPAYVIGLALMAAHIAVSQAEPVKYVMMRSGPEGVCDWRQAYLRQLPMPRCDLPPKL
jgi:hypothetical protein